jgi:hypothetical protein
MHDAVKAVLAAEHASKQKGRAGVSISGIQIRQSQGIEFGGRKH